MNSSTIARAGSALGSSSGLQNGASAVVREVLSSTSSSATSSGAAPLVRVLVSRIYDSLMLANGLSAAGAVAHHDEGSRSDGGGTLHEGEDQLCAFAQTIAIRGRP